MLLYDVENQAHSRIVLYILRFLYTLLSDLKPHAVILLVTQILYAYEENSLIL